MKRMGMWVVVALACWLAPGAEAKTGIYRWIDAQGQAHFGDRPGAADAQEYSRYEHSLSIIDTAAARRLQATSKPNPLVERELRWQRDGREQQRRAAEKAIETKKRHCAKVRGQLDAAGEARQRARLIKLEEQWYRDCR